MNLIVQPEDGVAPLIKGIDSAKKSIEIAIFRLDHTEIKRALERAVARGISVQALIASTNRGGEKDLRKLEMDLLPAGIEVARTADDLVRYHYKFMIVDRRLLYMLAFNYTYLDVGSRSFGIITENPELVREAVELFRADIKRQTYSPHVENFVVSPINARQEISRFIQAAEKELLIYDPEVSDRRIIQSLRDRTRKGVEIRIIGRVSKAATKVGTRGLIRMRFHTRTIIRDGRAAFVGSQSLRELELDKRRELGLIIHDHDVVHSMVKIFERDWATLLPAKRGEEETAPANVASKKVAKAVVRDLPLEPLVARALENALRKLPEAHLAGNKLEHSLEDAVRAAVEDAVSAMVKEAAETGARA